MQPWLLVSHGLNTQGHQQVASTMSSQQPAGCHALLLTIMIQEANNLSSNFDWQPSVMLAGRWNLGPTLFTLQILLCRPMHVPKDET